jgi:hypothetical protein
MRFAAGAAALIVLAALPTGCSVTKGKSAYPEQYQAFRDTANQACKDFFAADDAGHPRAAIAALRRLLDAKAPPDLVLRWKIFKSDVRRLFFAPKVVAARAAESLDEGALELGLDEC